MRKLESNRQFIIILQITRFNKLFNIYLILTIAQPGTMKNNILIFKNKMNVINELAFQTLLKWLMIMV